MPEMRLSTYYCVSLVTLHTSLFIVAQNWIMIRGTYIGDGAVEGWLRGRILCSE